jgi:acetate kinase
MNILIINCGSSSVKYQLFRKGRASPLAKGIAEKIGSSNSYIIHDKAGVAYRQKAVLSTYFSAIGKIIGLLVHPEWGPLKHKSQIKAVGHRVVHGGEEFKSSVIIDRNVLAKIKYYGRLAPLHNPPAYSGIKAAMKILPGIKQVAVFDTAFHQTMPQEAYIYGLPLRLYH